MSLIKYGGYTAQELKALVEAATPGEWMWTDSPDDELEVLVALESSESLDPREVLSDRDGISQAALRANYDLIAAARNALPDLLARIEQLEAELQAETENRRLTPLEAAIDEWCSENPRRVISFESNFCTITDEHNDRFMGQGPAPGVALAQALTHVK